MNVNLPRGAGEARSFLRAVKASDFCKSSRVLLLLVAVSGAPAFALPGCNIAPNPAFENLVGGLPSQWALLKTGSASGTASLSTYPDPVQSGSFSTKITVTTPGDLQWTSVPETSSIPVQGNTSYTISARLKVDSSGHSAGLRVIDWGSGSFKQDHFLATGAATTEWQTLESTFTTHPNATHVSIRLVHHLTSGTFYWDDVRLWKTVAGERCFDARHFVTQTTPGERWCHPIGVSQSICLDGSRNVAGEFVRDSSHGGRDYVSHTGDGISGTLGIGVVRNLDPGPGGQWRCFAEVGESCPTGSGNNVEFPPVYAPLMSSLPVVALADPTIRNPGAKALSDWEPIDVRELNPITGLQVGSAIGTIWNRAWGYIVPSVNFGAGSNLGTRQNVAVFEYEGIGEDPTGYGGGARLERYYYVVGVGMARAEGWQNDDCVDTPTPSNCDGTYANNVNGVAVFGTRVPLDFQSSVNGPALVLNNWWK